MSKEYTILIERGQEGSLIGTVVELPGCHTQGRTIDELLANMREAIELYQESTKTREVESEFIGIQRIFV